MLTERSLPPEAWCEVVGALELGLNTAVSDSTEKPPCKVIDLTLFNYTQPSK